MKYARARLSYPATPIEEPWNSEELLARLYRSGEDGAVDAVASLAPLQRAHLAMFCYHKSHLHRIGLAIAASCDEATLFQAFGTALGRVLSAQSREYRRGLGRATAGLKPKVSLAVGSLRRFADPVLHDDDGPDHATQDGAATYAHDESWADRGELAEVD
jgi:hypothetical protein